MTIQDFVTNILCIPVSRAGNIYMVEAIELYLDTKSPHFYSELSKITGKSINCLERAMRDAKSIGLCNMSEQDRCGMFGKNKLTTMQYVVLAAVTYRRDYEKQKS